MIVRAWVNGKLDEPTADGALDRPRRLWSRHVATKSLPWYGEEKARLGAFATLLGLRLDCGKDGHPGGTWAAIAVGDSCLAQVRGDDLLCFFPLTRTEQFGSRPHLLSSNAEGNDELGPHVHRLEGNWDVDDSFFLMTDALAGWFLSEAEAHRKPWHSFRDLATREEAVSFGDLVDQARDTLAMKNDDVTLVRIDLLGSHG